MADLPNSETAPLENRPTHLFEWTMAIAVFSTSFVILIWPKSIAFSAFHLILTLLDVVGLGPISLGLVYFAVGGGRILALASGDRFGIWSAGARATFAGASGVIWLQMVTAFVLIIPERGVPSPSMAIYVTLTLAECYSVYRALATARQQTG